MRPQIRNKTHWRGGGFKIVSLSETIVSMPTVNFGDGHSIHMDSGRKIRDRIAKLQERVIANELKAAAALHGWDQQFVPSPITPTYHVQYPNNSHDISLATSSTTMSTDSLMSFTPSFNVSPASFWSSDMMVPLSPTFMPADSCANMTIPVSNPHTQIGTHALMDGALEANAFQDISPTADSVFPESFKPTTNQPLCYAATGMSCVPAECFPEFQTEWSLTERFRSHPPTSYPNAQQHVTPIEDYHSRPS